MLFVQIKRHDDYSDLCLRNAEAGPMPRHSMAMRPHRGDSGNDAWNAVRPPGLSSHDRGTRPGGGRVLEVSRTRYRVRLENARRNRRSQPTRDTGSLPPCGSRLLAMQRGGCCKTFESGWPRLRLPLRASPRGGRIQPDLPDSRRANGLLATARPTR